MLAAKVRMTNSLIVALAVICYTGVIVCCVNRDKVVQASSRESLVLELALKLFFELQQSDLLPDVVTYSATISACEKCQQRKKAFAALDASKGDVEQAAEMLLSG